MGRAAAGTARARRRRACWRHRRRGRGRGTAVRWTPARPPTGRPRGSPTRSTRCRTAPGRRSSGCRRGDRRPVRWSGRRRRGRTGRSRPGDGRPNGGRSPSAGSSAPRRGGAGRGARSPARTSGRRGTASPTGARGRRGPCRRPPRARRPRSPPSPAATSRSAGRPAARRPCRSGRRGTSSRGPTGWPPCASSTSAFVDVETTAPGAARTFGTTSDDVLPDRDGPSTSADRSGPAHAHPPVRCRGRSRHRPVRSTPAHDDRSIGGDGRLPVALAECRNVTERCVASRRVESPRDVARRVVTKRRVTLRCAATNAVGSVVARCRVGGCRDAFDASTRPTSMVSMLDLSAETNCDCKEPETQRGSDGVNTELRKTFVRSSDHHTKRSSLEHTSRVDVDRVPTIAETGDAGHHPVAAGRCDHNMRTVKQCGCRTPGCSVSRRLTSSQH